MKLKQDSQGNYCPASVLYINAVMMQQKLSTVSEAIDYINKVNENEDKSKKKTSSS